MDMTPYLAFLLNAVTGGEANPDWTDAEIVDGSVLVNTPDGPVEFTVRPL